MRQNVDEHLQIQDKVQILLSAHDDFRDLSIQLRKIKEFVDLNIISISTSRLQGICFLYSRMILDARPGLADNAPDIKRNCDATLDCYEKYKAMVKRVNTLVAAYYALVSRLFTNQQSQ